MTKYYDLRFKVTGYDHSFRITKIKPTLLLSISMLFSEDSSIEDTEQIFDFALKHTEVLVIDKWMPVVEAVNDQLVYMPADIEDNFVALNEIITFFVKNVLRAIFTKSSK